MKAAAPITKITYWQSKELCNIGFASYTLEHHSFPRHFHEHYVIELVVQGADQFYCNGKTQTAISNELVCINPGEVHTGSTAYDHPLCYYSIYPGKRELQQIASLLEIILPTDFCFQQLLSSQPQLATKMRLLFETILSVNPEAMQCEELFLDLMHPLLENIGSNANGHFKALTKDVRIQHLIDYIHTSFTEPLSLQHMAAHINVSPYHLIRLFKSATGLSPYEYLLSLRMEYAKQLLQKGYSVKHAAWKAGFYDTSHFNRLFRKVSGTNPKVFRSSK
jgi:AraC-like DNA-binding protein